MTLRARPSTRLRDSSGSRIQEAPRFRHSPQVPREGVSYPVDFGVSLWRRPTVNTISPLVA